MSKIFSCASKGCQIWICMMTGSTRGIFICELLHVEEIFSVRNSTLIFYFSMLSNVGLIRSSWILTSDEKLFEIDLVVQDSSCICNLCTERPTNFKELPIRNGSHGIPCSEHGLRVTYVSYVHKSLPLELSGLQCVCDRLVTSKKYIQTHKTYFQVGRTLWLSWIIR